ncbi:MAG: hypothetical protein IPI79_03635 [Moraxellaceae bacterium]|nr:hypothetical protein [Moraxellaceae bacterium]
MPPYPAALPHQYCLETQIPQGFALVKYFKEQIAANEIPRGTTRPRLVGGIRRLVDTKPAGANGLMWRPSLSVQASGESISQGALLGSSTQHSKADWYRVLVEGLLFALKDGQVHVEQHTKQKISQLFAAGGGSQSNAVMQTAADIFNMPIYKPHTRVKHQDLAQRCVLRWL